MTEIEDLIGIYGAIDHAVVDNPELIDVVSPLLGAYRHDAAGWFDEYTAWTAEQIGGGIDGSMLFPGLVIAMNDLADLPSTGYMHSRRILAVAVLIKVFPELDAAGAEADLAVGPLTRVVVTDEDVDQARALLELLRDLESLDDWSDVITRAFDAGLISETTAMQSAAAPCSGRLITVNRPGDSDPVATLESHFCTDAISYEQAIRFLDPENWPCCHPLWCSMDRTGTSTAGNPVYKEVVSSACGSKFAWTAEACLEFRMVTLPDGALITYDLCEDSPQPGDMILVDSGSLRVVKNGNGVCVYTTKRILFNHPFSGGSLAMLTCALGYGSAVKDLVFTCAALDTCPGTEFPGQDLPATIPEGATPVSQQQPSTIASAKPTPGGGAPDKAIKDAIDEGIDAAKKCIEECATAYQESYGKMTDGKYGANEAVADLANMWTRMLRDGARLVDIGLRTSQAVARRPPAPQPPRGPTPAPSSAKKAPAKTAKKQGPRPSPGTRAKENS